MTKRQALIIFFLISAAVLLLNAFPNYYAYIKTPPGMSFSGQASWFDPWDLNVYVAAIKWGQQGQILLQNAYTTTSHTPVLMYPLYTLAGFLLPGVQAYFLFHILAAVFGFLLLITLYKSAELFLRNTGKSLLAVLLIALGGGIGWLLFPNLLSADISMTGFTFISHFQRGHEALGMIFYLLSLVLFFKGSDSGRKSIYLFSFVCLALLIFFYPYYFLSHLLINGAWGMYLYFRYGKTQPLKLLFIGTLSILPFLIAYYLHLRPTTGFSGVLTQSLATPEIRQLFLGYGVILPLLGYSLWKGPKNHQVLYLGLWFLVSFSLALLPLGFARFFLRGLFFPAILIILLNIKSLSAAIKLSPVIIIVLVSITLPISGLFITFKRLEEVKNNNQWYYVTAEERRAMDFLDKNSKSSGGVLAGYTLGNYIPANSKNSVYFGHLLQTPNSSEKINNLLQFYSGDLPEDKAKQFLQSEQISYIVFGTEEQTMVKTTKNTLFEYPFLKPVFTDPSVTIFQLLPEL